MLSFPARWHKLHRAKIRDQSVEKITNQKLYFLSFRRKKILGVLYGINKQNDVIGNMDDWKLYRIKKIFHRGRGRAREEIKHSNFKIVHPK